MTLQDLDKLEADYGPLAPGMGHSDYRVAALCQWARRAMEAMRAMSDLMPDWINSDHTADCYACLAFSPDATSAIPCVPVGDLRRLAEVYRELTEEPRP